MDFSVKKSSFKNKKVQVTEDDDVNIYSKPEFGDFRFDILLKSVKARLDLIKCLNRIGDETSTSAHSQVLNKYSTNLKDIHEQAKIYSERYLDTAAFYMLMLAFSKSQETCSLFIESEVKLLRLRFQKSSLKMTILDNLEVELMSALNGSAPTFFSTDEINNLRETFQFFKESMNEGERCLKVPFAKAIDLVRFRSVYVHDGFTYIPERYRFDFLCSEYKEFLSVRVESCSQRVSLLCQDHRMASVVDYILNNYSNDDYVNLKEGADIDISNIDEIAKESFPPCMLNLHLNLRKNHHLKHFGRLQYGLFLKGIGLTVEQQLEFWKKEFLHRMDMDKFKKTYEYNIRYNYGLEGKRVNPTPYSCLKIIKGTSGGQDDHHGCPFKHFDKKSLEGFLHNYEVTFEDVEDIFKNVNSTHYHVACTKLLECSGKVPKDTLTVTNPNQYFEESRRTR